MCDTNNQLPDATPSFTLTSTGGSDWHGNSATAWSCGKCGNLIYAGSVHHCPTGLGPALYPQPVSIPTVWTEPQTERRPHVCPVCAGRGLVEAGTTSVTGAGETCPACKGACVLWG
jgi:rubrerythrin